MAAECTMLKQPVCGCPQYINSPLLFLPDVRCCEEGFVFLWSGMVPKTFTGFLLAWQGSSVGPGALWVMARDDTKYVLKKAMCHPLQKTFIMSQHNGASVCDCTVQCCCWGMQLKHFASRNSTADFFIWNATLPVRPKKWFLLLKDFRLCWAVSLLYTAEI